MLVKITVTIGCLIFASLGVQAQATSPVLNFSDLDSGPKNGNTDGFGSGAIVTIWGNNLGEIQGSSKVYVGDVEATAIYYWKNADGQLPGGPANLDQFHRMQEVAFSVPAGAVDGVNTIKVRIDGVDSNSLPFTVRSGEIRFIKPTGLDTSTCGSWSSPCHTPAAVFAGDLVEISTGSIWYDLGTSTNSQVIMGRNQPINVNGTSASPVAFVSYPGYRSSFSPTTCNSSANGVFGTWYPTNPDLSSKYVHISKFSLTAYGNDPDCPVGIQPTQGNRVVGVEITGPTVYGGYSGAIGGSAGNNCNPGAADAAGGGKYFGNYIHNYGYQSTIPGKNNYGYTYDWDSDSWTSPPYDGVGDECTNCSSVDRFQHLFYLSNRSCYYTIEPYEIAWGYYADNPILEGLHVYDTGMEVPSWSGPILLHHNVIKNQRGGAIDSNTADIYVYNNIIIYDIATKLQGVPFQMGPGTGNVRAFNNTVYGWHNPSVFQGVSGDFKNNIMYDSVGITFIHSLGLPSVSSNNLFYSPTGTPSPGGTNGFTTNPKFVNDFAYNFGLQLDSPAVDSGYDVGAVIDYDLIGSPRYDGIIDRGAYEFVQTGSTDEIPPEEPSGLAVQ